MTNANRVSLPNNLSSLAEENGAVARPWFQFFTGIWRRVGGSTAYVPLLTTSTVQPIGALTVTGYVASQDAEGNAIKVAVVS